MVTFRSLALLSVAALASAQDTSSLTPCQAGCYTNTMNQAGTYACGASDLTCLCAKPDWGNAIYRCAVDACADTTGILFAFARDTACNGAIAFVPDAAQAPPTPTPAPETPLTPTPTPTPIPTPTPTPTPNLETPGVLTPTTPSTPSAETPTPTPSDASSPEATPPSSSVPSSSTDAATTPSASDAEETSAAPVAPASGLSQGAKVGLGVGITAVVLAFVGVGVFVFLRNRRNGGGGGSDDGPSMNERYNISPPVPQSSSSPYSHDNGSSVYEVGGSSGDLKAFRYEEMVPRVQPRQMV